jgi:rhodanese-related sulfurtransferase
MQPRMIDGAGDLGEDRGMALPWWLPFGKVPEIPPRKLAGELAAADFAAAVPPAQIVDVRTATEFRRGHIRGAISVPLPELRDRLPGLGLERNRKVVAICLTAHRSIPAVRLLARAGFDAAQLARGMLAWRADGFPEETGEPGLG